MGSGLADCWVSGNSSCNIEEGENSFVRAQNNIPFAAEAHGSPVSRGGGQRKLQIPPWCRDYKSDGKEGLFASTGQYGTF